MNSFKRVLMREGSVVVGFAVAAGIWYLFFLFVAPLASEFIARSVQDFSYLWDGSSRRMGAIAHSGAFVLLCLAPAWLCLRIFRRTWQRVLNRETRIRLEGRTTTWGQFLLWEVFAVVAILALSGGLFYFSHTKYAALKEQYFREVVIQKKEYRALSAREKVLAYAQYERIHPQAAVEDMLADYGWHARSIYYAQAWTPWVLMWGYPLYALLRFLTWAVKRLQD